ncbi:MAG: GntR family transcriptional regulator [Armatimonadota bacterium]|nr:GntR family transcriptional regulator [Armatimonadota bacterium]
MTDAPAHRFEPLPAQRLGDRVYQHLIEAIATNRLPQGAKIQEDVLAEQMGVSKTPVREALRRLEAEGFISVDPHRTPEVRRLEPRDIEELYGVREFLERLAVRTITEVRPAGILAEMETVQAAAEARLASGETTDVAESVSYNRRFHGLIFHGAGNRRLLRLYELIDVDVRRLSFQSIRVSGRRRDAVIQHRAILEAIKAGDADRAEALMIQHVQQARSDLLRQMAATAEPPGRV